MRNLYQVLGIASEADDSQLKSAFRNLAKTFHPDLNGGDRRAEERFKEVNRAYEVLRNPDRRAEHDAFLAGKRSSARQRFWKAAATMSATFVVCIAVCFSVVIWLAGQRFPLALDRETARPDGAARQETDLRIAIASAAEPAGIVEPRAPEASSVGPRTTNKRSVRDRWIAYQRRRAPSISKVTLSGADTTKLHHSADRTPSRTPHAEAELAQGDRMLRKGEHFLTQGNIVIAREYFARAAALGLPIAALRLAETHDPHELWRFPIHGLKHDPAEAKRWYERALELGVKEAEPRLRRLAGR